MKSNLYKIISIFSAMALVVQSFLPSAFLFIPIVQANEMCAVDVDVVLVMDTSGSMKEGGSPRKCEWENLEWVMNEFGGTSMCVYHQESGLNEEECLAKPDPPQCDSPVFTPEKNSKITDAKNAANSFLDNLEDQDQSALISFKGTAFLDKLLSNNHQDTEDVIDGLVANGATNIGEAIDKGVEELSSERANSQANKVMILLTDGKSTCPYVGSEIDLENCGYNEDEGDIQYSLDAAQEAASASFKIFTVGLGSNSEINETMLQNIANITGAKYYHAPNSADLEAIYDDIAWEMCQYGSIAGCKYNDSDGDGDIDGEDELSGWEINLTGGPNGPQSQLTDDDGCYVFAGLQDAEYTISETLQEGWVQTYPQGDSHTIVISNHNDVEDIDFGNFNSSTCSASEVSRQCIAHHQAEVEYGYNYPICGDNYTQTEEDQTCIVEPQVNEGDIVINEIMQDPDAVSDTHGEWFEVYNTTDSNIDISGCVIKDLAINNHTITSLNVPAQGYVVLARNGNPALNGGITPDYVYSSFILNNSSDQIILICGQIEIDRVEYDGGPNFPDPTGASMILKDPGLDNNNGANWCVSTTPFGAGDLGTPGSQNDTCGAPEPELGSISGYKYNDANNNNHIEQPEEKLSGWTIILKQQAGEVWSQINSAVTGDSGYLFSNLNAGVYRVEESLEGKDGWTQTYPNNPNYHEVDLGQGENVPDKNFANYYEEQLPAPICGNGIIEQEEQCDDGNTENGDSCSSVCLTEEPPPPPIPEINPGDIVINEIMYKPKAVVDSVGEWFEVYNTTDSDINIQNCIISDTSDSHTIQNSANVLAYSYALLAINGDSNQNGGILPDYVYSDINLDNGFGGDKVILTCNNVEIDRVEYDNGPEFPSSEDGVSIILADPSLDNNTGSNWCISSSVFGAGDLGTPKSQNDSCDISFIYGYKFFDNNKDSDKDVDDSGLSDWTINLKQLVSCAIDGEKWADTVVSSSQGLNEEGNPVIPERSNPNAALGQAEYDTASEHFFTLGINGSIVLGFNNYIINGAGNDIEIVEATDLPYPNESVDVYISQDGINWTFVGNHIFDTLIDISDYDPNLLWVKYVKLVDTTNPDDHNNGADAYDLDGVAGLHCGSDWGIVDTETTDVDGYYLFKPLNSGIYRVEEILKDGWTNITTLYKDLNLEDNQGIQVDFGNYQETQPPLGGDGGGGGGSFVVYSVACGDNIVDLTYEQCDDGNTTNGDGCSSTCKIEGKVAGETTEQEEGEQPSVEEPTETEEEEEEQPPSGGVGGEQIPPPTGGQIAGGEVEAEEETEEEPEQGGEEIVLPEEIEGSALGFFMASVGDFLKSLGKASASWWILLIVFAILGLIWLFLSAGSRRKLFFIFGLVIFIILLIICLIKKFVWWWLVILLLIIYFVLALIFGKSSGEGTV